MQAQLRDPPAVTLPLLLRLGRVSNLPTVCTNVLAGLVLAGAAVRPATVLALCLTAAALYVAGMVLNDVYDAEIDAHERPERPIPSGAIGRTEAARWGWGLLALGVAIATVAGLALRSTASLVPGACAGITAALVVLYDRNHKGNRFAPVIMGACRMGIYAIAASFAIDGPGEAWLGGALLAAYVLGLTYIAGFENRSAVARLWPLLGLFAPVAWAAWHAGGSPHAWAIIVALALWVVRAIRLARIGEPLTTRTAVVSLIAGIALVDAAAIAARGHHGLAWLAIVAFGMTLVLQRRVAGT
jgi:UbiA prenyltransferase family